jgi:hypothetical protein
MFSFFFLHRKYPFGNLLLAILSGYANCHFFPLIFLWWISDLARFSEMLQNLISKKFRILYLREK